jgi:hypothetical protein
MAKWSTSRWLTFIAFTLALAGCLSGITRSMIPKEDPVPYAIVWIIGDVVAITLALIASRSARSVEDRAEVGYLNSSLAVASLSLGAYLMGIAIRLSR